MYKTYCQSGTRPNEITRALTECFSSDNDREVRIASAYVTQSGLTSLLQGLYDCGRLSDFEACKKVLVTCPDFGLTDPDALRYWLSMTSASVLLHNASLLESENLIPTRAFHAKAYLNIGGRAGHCFLGSPNLTQRALTVNCETGFLGLGVERANLDKLWSCIHSGAINLTEGHLSQYSKLRAKSSQAVPEDFKELPASIVNRPETNRSRSDFDEIEDLAQSFKAFWVESRDNLEGGARNQLEMPRGSHRFFGLTFSDYDTHDAITIGTVQFISASGVAVEKPIKWHGDNQMERVYLPTVNQGGISDYSHALILFEQVDNGESFLIRVADKESAQAAAWRAASGQVGHVYRVGPSSPRLFGLLP